MNKIMIDITLCINCKYSKEKTCERIQTPPQDYGQSYSYFEEIDGECEYYIEKINN